MDEKINIICWKWKKQNPPSTKSGKEFFALHVNRLYNMLQRHLHMPHQLVCVTDDPTAIKSEVKVIPMIDTFSKFGGCYRRLTLFDPNLNGDFGRRFVCIDLDVVIVDDITPIFSNEADFIIWGEEARKTPYCGSMWMMDAGSRPRVWRIFNNNPHHAIILSKRKFKVGSDQSFITYCLYPNEETWTTEDGVYNFKLDIKKPTPHIQKQIDAAGNEKITILNIQKRIKPWKKKKLARIAAKRRKEAEALGFVFKEKGVKRKCIPDYEIIMLNRPTGELPENAKMIFFNGKFDPSDPAIQKENPWITEHWI